MMSTASSESSYYHSSSTTDDATHRCILHTEQGIESFSDEGVDTMDAEVKRAQADGRRIRRRKKRTRHQRALRVTESLKQALSDTTSDSDENRINSAEETRGIPKRYQSLPRFDLGLDDPKGLADDAFRENQAHGTDDNKRQVSFPTPQTMRKQRTRKLSEMTPKYVEHYKTVVQKQRHDRVNSRQIQGTGQVNSYTMFSPRRHVVPLGNDAPLAPIAKANLATHTGIHTNILPDITTHTSPNSVRQPVDDTRKIRQDILKSLDITENGVDHPASSKRNPTGDVDMEEEVQEECFIRPWLHLIEDAAPEEPGKARSLERVNRKPVATRVDELITEDSGVPGLAQTGLRGTARQRKLGALVSPRRLSELLECTSPMRMEDRHNHYQ